MSDDKPLEIPSKASPAETTPPPFEDKDRALGGVSDLVRRAVMAGVGAVFLTEEGIRKTVSELKLPKEAFGYLSTQAEKTRTEASRVVRKELRRFLNSDKFKDQMLQALGGLTLEIKAEVRVKPSDGKSSPGPEFTTKVRVKNTPTEPPKE